MEDQVSGFRLTRFEMPNCLPGGDVSVMLDVTQGPSSVSGQLRKLVKKIKMKNTRESCLRKTMQYLEGINNFNDCR